MAAWLLCDELANLGCKISIFSPQGLQVGSGQLPASVKVISAIIKRGCRWKVPEKTLTWQVNLSAFKNRPAFIFVIGMTYLTGKLLSLRLSSSLVIWETTMANPGNKFVDPQAVRRLHKCRAMLSPSKAVDDGIRETYGFEGPIIRLPFWVKEYSDNLNTVIDEKNHNIDFLYLGRKDEDKGIKELLLATAEVRRQRPETHIVVCGPGSDAPFLSMAKRLGLASAARFTFLRDPNDLPGLIRRCRWLILPSKHEGYPLVILEAAQQGRPFIATRVGSIPEICQNTQAAIIIPPNDEHSLCEAMLKALSESETDYKSRGDAAHSLFLEVSGADIVNANLRTVIEQLIALKL